MTIKSYFDNLHARLALFIMAASDGLKCRCMQWHSGDDQTALQETRKETRNSYKKRLQRWFVIKTIEKEKQHNYIILEAGEVGEERSKKWDISKEELKDPANVWKKCEQSVGLAHIFRIHRLHLAEYKQNENETIDEF